VSPKERFVIEMKVVETELKDVVIIEPDVFGDDRGWFMETYCTQKYANAGITIDFVQDNQSYSKQVGILRGIHFQNDPMAQSKLVRCTRGKILDVAVDLRRGSPNYKKWIAVELNEVNKKQLLIPQGFGHAFLTLSDDAEVQYKCDQFYSKANDRSIRFDDPELGIVWPKMDYILSQKDLNAPYLAQSDCNFIYGKDGNQ